MRGGCGRLCCHSLSPLITSGLGWQLNTADFTAHSQPRERTAPPPRADPHSSRQQQRRDGEKAKAPHCENCLKKGNKKLKSPTMSDTEGSFDDASCLSPQSPGSTSPTRKQNRETTITVSTKNNREHATQGRQPLWNNVLGLLEHKSLSWSNDAGVMTAVACSVQKCFLSYKQRGLLSISEMIFLFLITCLHILLVWAPVVHTALGNTGQQLHWIRHIFLSRLLHKR